MKARFCNDSKSICIEPETPLERQVLKQFNKEIDSGNSTFGRQNYGMSSEVDGAISMLIGITKKREEVSVLQKRINTVELSLKYIEKLNGSLVLKEAIRQYDACVLTDEDRNKIGCGRMLDCSNNIDGEIHLPCGTPLESPEDIQLCQDCQSKKNDKTTSN